MIELSRKSEMKLYCSLPHGRERERERERESDDDDHHHHGRDEMNLRWGNS